jgi:multidrug efflux pump
MTRFTDIFIQRPVLAIVVSSLLLLFGISSLFQVGVREFPELERSVIYVETAYRGASARSLPGQSSIEVHVRLGENSSDVLSEVIAKVREARYELPRDIEDPVVRTQGGGDAMIYLAFYSKQMTPYQISDFLLRNVQPELATLPGVGRAGLFGRPLAMRIWLDPVRMAAFGVTATDVNEAIKRDNFIATAGSTEGGMVRASVDARTDLQTPQEFAALVVRQDGEERVRLGDVATVEFSAETTQIRTYSSGRDAVFMAIVLTPDANPLEVSEAVHAALPRIREMLPADLELFVDWDGSVVIDEALEEVIKTLLEAALIVILVIYLFLGSLRVVLIPLVAIPLSLIGVVSLIMAMGFTLNLLTLLAMVIAIGLVVDDAIVVVENVHRHIEMGATPMEAAIHGAREVAWPVIAMTLTLAAVYAPISFIGGLTGALFSEFALTLAGAVLVSGIVALTLSPMMCSRVLQDREHQGRFADWLDHRFEWLIEQYRKALSHCLDNRGAVLLFAVCILGSIPVLFSLAQQELAPEEDAGGFYLAGSAPRHANIDYSDLFLNQVVDIWKQIPEVSHSWQVIRPDRNFGGVTLHHWDERERTQQEVQAEFQREIQKVTGMQLFSFGVPALPGSDAGLPVSFVVASTADYSEVMRVGEQLLQAARESGLFIFITQTLEFDRPEVTVNIDRERAARLGISMQDIGETLAVMLGEAEVNRFNLEGRSYKVIPQAEQGFRLTKEELEKYYLRTSSDELVPMSAVPPCRAS